MSPLRDAVKAYLAIRRSLGYQLYGHELLLGDFVEFAQRNGVDTVTIELAVRWARLEVLKSGASNLAARGTKRLRPLMLDCLLLSAPGTAWRSPDR